ncbi:MAG: peptidoglycan DD-metalloendopeptidase family protein [Lachnospiraceae bacterium]|nr:peptidoglycan DD-metalloendopeptidase family protein [Ruminococcus sp.]MCM1274723.1 peptidoglycan DD-metalloendopeptidase family protein [Lachnospiraceae bacterium]
MGIKKIKGGALTRVCAVLAAAALAVSLLADGAPVRASGSDSIEDLQERAKQIQAENQQREEQINNLEGDIAENEDAMNLVSEQIDGVTAEIATYSELVAAKIEAIEEKQREIKVVEENIADKELEIERKQGEIADLREQNKQNLKKFAKLARALYINDTSGTIPILNGSNDWYDFFMYSDVVKNIGGQNMEFMKRLMDSIKEQERLIEELNSDIDRLEEDKAELGRQQAALEAEKTALEAEKADLEDYAAERQDYLYGLSIDNEAMQSRIDGLYIDMAAGNAALEQLNEEIEELIRQAQANNGDEIEYGDGFRWPLDSKYQSITTYFGYDSWRNGNHKGIDISGGGIAGSNIYAAQSGTVISVVNYCGHNYGKSWSCGCGGGYGNYVIVSHGGDLATLYAHAEDIIVYEGQHVEIGDVLGYVGSTGWSTGAHLHFEVRVNGSYVDPFNYSYQ